MFTNSLKGGNDILPHFGNKREEEALSSLTLSSVIASYNTQGIH